MPQATRIFMRGLEALPDDILRSAVLEKYASAERSRLRLILATWDLEATQRHVHTLERIQRHLETTHDLCESEFNFWLKMYTDRGLPDLKEDELFYGDGIPSVSRQADRDATELSVMTDCAGERGLDVGSPIDGGHETNSDEQDVTLDEDLVLGRS